MELNLISNLLYQLKLANQEMTSTFEKETGFSITRYELMMYLKANGQSTQIALQNTLKIDSAAVTRHLKILEENEYVVRQRNPQNNREILVNITKKAIIGLDKCAKEHISPENRINLSLDENEVETLLHLLTKLVK